MFLNDRVDLFLDKEKLSSIYVLNEEEQIYMHYYRHLVSAKKIDTSKDVWVTQARLYLEKTIDHVRIDCNGDEGYSKKGNLTVNPEKRGGPSKVKYSPKVIFYFFLIYMIKKKE